MDNVELILTDLSEEATKMLAIKQKPQSLKKNIELAHIGGEVSKVARKHLEDNLKETIITKNNRLDYEYIKNKDIDKLK